MLVSLLVVCFGTYVNAEMLVSRPMLQVCYPLAAEDHSFVALPFSLSQAQLIADISNQLATVESIYVWDAEYQVYQDLSLYGEDGTSASNREDGLLTPGSVFSVFNASASDSLLMLTGAMPPGGTNTISIHTGLNLIGSPFLSSVRLPHAAIEQDLPSFDEGASVLAGFSEHNQAPVHLLGNQQGQVRWVRSTDGENAAPTMDFGVGYWYYHALDPVAWDFTSPHASEFVEGPFPVITEITTVSDLTTITMVRTPRVSGRAVIVVQRLEPGQGLDVNSAWTAIDEIEFTSMLSNEWSGALALTEATTETLTGHAYGLAFNAVQTEAGDWLLSVPSRFQEIDLEATGSVGVSRSIGGRSGNHTQEENPGMAVASMMAASTPESTSALGFKVFSPLN